MDFGEILSRAWKIIWNHKILWLFGFLAALGGGGGNGSDGSGGSGIQYNFPNNGGPDFNFRQFDNAPQWFQRFFETIPVWLPILLVLFALVLFVVVVILSTYGRIGLTRGAWLADEGEASLGLGQLWGYGTRFFWRVLLLSLILIVLSIIVALIVIIPTIGISVLTLGIGLICLLPLLCVVALAFALVSVVFDLATISIVNEDQGVMDGLRRGWEVFRAHLGEMIGMALILWVIGLVIGFIIALPMVLIVAPLIVGAISQTRAVFGGGALLSLGLFLLYLPILMVIQGILRSYIGTTWTLTFRRLTGRPAQSAPGAQTVLPEQSL